MSLSDVAGESLDPAADRLVVIFNAGDEPLSFPVAEWAGRPMALHPVLAESADPLVREAAWDEASGTFRVPGRTTAVFVQPEGSEPAEAIAAAQATAVPTPEPAVEATATAEPEPTQAPAVTATAELVTVAPLATEVAGEETAAEPTVELTPPPPSGPNMGRTEVTALAILVIIGAAGAVVGLVAWLRARVE